MINDYIKALKLKLYITALITSPIIALYGASPFFIFEKIDFFNWVKLVGGITLEVFVVWLVHIYFESNYPNQKKLYRFSVTYIISTILRLPSLLILPVFKPMVPVLIEKYIAYPIITSFAANVIVLVIVQSIVNGYKKAESENQIQELKWQNTEAQKQVLIQQLHPHFLFNALSTLKSLISEKPKEAEKYTLQLSDFLRYTVQSKNQELVTLEKEWQFVRDYLNLQKIRFYNAVIGDIAIEDVYLQKKIPIMALQVLVENIFKHNYFTEKKPLHFSIKVAKDSIIVWNEKKSLKLSEKNNTGLTNLNARYQMICNKCIEISETANEFQVTIPLL